MVERLSSPALLPVNPLLARLREADAQPPPQARDRGAGRLARGGRGGRRGRRPRGAGPDGVGRRRGLGLSMPVPAVRAAGAAAASAAALAAYAAWVEPRRLVVRRRDLALPNWPPALDGLRVALVSDLHSGAPHVKGDRVREVAERVRRVHPDLALLLGDFVDRAVLL